MKTLITEEDKNFDREGYFDILQKISVNKRITKEAQEQEKQFTVSDSSNEQNLIQIL